MLRKQVLEDLRRIGGFKTTKTAQHFRATDVNCFQMPLHDYFGLGGETATFTSLHGEDKGLVFLLNFF